MKHMLTIMLFATAIALLPAFLNTSSSVPAAYDRTAEDVRGAIERAA